MGHRRHHPSRRRRRRWRRNGLPVLDTSLASIEPGIAHPDAMGQLDGGRRLLGGLALKHAGTFVIAISLWTSSGCLWLFPIEKKEAKSELTGTAGTSDTDSGPEAPASTAEGGSPESLIN